MHIHALERKWLYVVCAMLGLFLLSIFYTGLRHVVHPPGKVETIDSARLHLSEEFAEDQLGVRLQEDGSVRVTLVAARYGFHPRQVEVPADTPITFRIASTDVLHGLHIPMTNLSTMIVPGYVAEVTTTFPLPGEFPLLCNEYCGLGHDHMWSRLTVVPRHAFRPATSPTEANP